MCAHGDALPAQEKLAQRTREDQRRGQSARKMSAAARIITACIAEHTGEIGMPGTGLLLQFAVIA